MRNVSFGEPLGGVPTTLRLGSGEALLPSDSESQGSRDSPERRRFASLGEEGHNEEKEKVILLELTKATGPCPVQIFT